MLTKALLIEGFFYCKSESCGWDKLDGGRSLLHAHQTQPHWQW